MKKIAAKVIAKKASALSVAHANDSANLNGRAPTTFLDRIDYGA